MRAIAFSVVFVSIAACGSNERADKKPAAAPAQQVTSGGPAQKVAVEVKSSEAGSNGFITSIRAVSANVAIGDPFEMAIHWEQTGGPKVDDWGGRFRGADQGATVATLEFRVKTPAGTTYSLKARPSLEQPVTYVIEGATALLAIDSQGLSTMREPIGPWIKTAPSFSSEGIYEVSVEGAIVDKNHGRVDFATPAIRFSVAKKHPAKRFLLDAATTALNAKVKEDPPEMRGGAEAGFVEAMVIENEDGTRVIRFARFGGQFRWGFDLHSVLLNEAGRVERIDKQEIGTCVAASTLIATAAGPKAAGEIRAGDRVWGQSDTGQRVLTKVLDIRRSIARQTVVIGKLRATPTHPIYRNGAWVRAGFADVDQRIDEPIEVIELTVEPPHTYFADGVLSHNKDRMYWPALDDPWHFMFNPEALKRK